MMIVKTVLSSKNRDGWCRRGGENRDGLCHRGSRTWVLWNIIKEERKIGDVVEEEKTEDERMGGANEDERIKMGDVVEEEKT
ncbi:hypothetical protein C1H46_040345 [Malus baccata]|uniref:Uncharacterized protein n=1 Tax=Malus baccata TaxID=106549 RepID=A0A540KIU2_MALBA|nr:hypothetical protein C1H46_040345 [Malus baccata]